MQHLPARQTTPEPPQIIVTDSTDMSIIKSNNHVADQSDSSSNASEHEMTDTSIGSTPETTATNTPAFALHLIKYELTEIDLKNIYDLFISIAYEAGKIMLTAEQALLTSADTKNNTADIVTAYDKQVEAMVQTRLHTTYPSIAFFGEETYKPGARISTGPTFICDPIDGTLNFSHGVPSCAISLAFAIDRQPIVGVVYNPFREEIYSAIKNQGAFLSNMHNNTRSLLPFRRVPPPLPSLTKCLMAIEWGNQRSGPNWALRTSVHNTLLTSAAEGGSMIQSIRSNGSAALDMCYVAAGYLDAFWEGGVWAWDVAAGWIILEEAGGIVASANPGDWNPELEGRVYFAVRGAKHEEQRGIVEGVWEIMGNRKFVYPSAT